MFLYGGSKGESMSLPFSAFTVRNFPWHMAPSFILQSILDIVQDAVTSTMIGEPIHPERDF